MISGPVVPYPETPVLEAIRKRAKKTPGKEAVVVWNRAHALTYRDLDLTNLDSLVRSVDPILHAKYEFAEDPGEHLDTPFYLASSSGTTGRPKGVWRTQRNVLSRLAWETAGPDEMHLIYPHGLPRLLTGLLTGTKVAVLQDGEDLFVTLNTIRALRATHLTMWPRTMAVAVDHDINLGPVKEVVAIGAPLTQLTRERFSHRYPYITIVEGYGSTETGYCLRDGVPVANVSAWVESGCLMISGPTVGYGYVGEPPAPGGVFTSVSLGRAFLTTDRAREEENRIILLQRGEEK
jgi:acyl-coenzyme A synthetase/AMP-(fatty) acid ligase